MDRIVAVSRRSRNVTQKRNKTVSRDVVIGPTAIKFVAIVICAVLALVYLTQSTAGANRSIKVRGLETKRGQLLLEKERLEVEQTRLKSLKEIDGGVEKNVMEPMSSVEHINAHPIATGSN
ncbi:MAG: hypothetical protein BWY68_00155 [bacterium ADurb.Bin400]|nr:MAG: hypothetical protein BWY68_00155 [bacterium ADurb.Bin400]